MAFKTENLLWGAIAVVAAFALIPKATAAPTTPVVNGIPTPGATYGLNTVPAKTPISPIYGGGLFSGVNQLFSASTGGISNPPAAAADTTGGSFQTYGQPVIPLDYGNIAI